MPRFITITEVARRLSTTTANVAEWAKAGVFPAPVTLPDGELRWAKRDVKSWMDSLVLSKNATLVHRELPELANEIIQALTEAGGWLHGAEIARAVSPDADHTSGHWRDTLRLLRDAGQIKSDRKKGYCISPTSDPSLGEPSQTPDAVELRLSPNALCVLQALAEAKGWLRGPNLSMKALGDDKSRNGGFHRNADKMKDAGLIETDKQLGYRITDRGREYLAANPDE